MSKKKEKKDPRGLPDQDSQYDKALVRITSRHMIFNMTVVQALDYALREATPGYFNERIDCVALGASLAEIIILCDSWNIEKILTWAKEFLHSEWARKQYGIQGWAIGWEVRNVSMSVNRPPLPGVKKFFRRCMKEWKQQKECVEQKTEDKDES